jgi:hypothetical protein
VPKKLEWLAFSHLLECKELADALLLRGQSPYQFSHDRGVGFSFWWRGER